MWRFSQASLFSFFREGNRRYSRKREATSPSDRLNLLDLSGTERPFWSEARRSCLFIARDFFSFPSFNDAFESSVRWKKARLKTIVQLFLPAIVQLRWLIDVYTKTDTRRETVFPFSDYSLCRADNKLNRVIRYDNSLLASLISRKTWGN